MIEDGIYAEIEACLNGFHADELLSGFVFVVTRMK